MLPPDARAILRDLLKPPAGHSLDHAVGTTFTIDLAATLAVPLSFAARDLGATPDPVGVMEAVRSCSDRIDVFYQAGQAAVPSQGSDVLAFLEPVLHPVTAPRPGHLFHPKVWLLKYLDPDGAASYRFLCSTRNLTNDRSWDAVISLDGAAGTRPAAGNAPLARFLCTLPGMALGPLPEVRRERLDSLAEELRRVVWELPDNASALSFHALGLGGPESQPDFSGYRRLVVSPFVDADGLATLIPDSRSSTVVVARPEHLDRLETVPANIELKVLTALAELEDERAGGELSGLHAKLTIVERARLAHLFLGSANATRAAYGGNVEFLVEVVRGAAKYGVDAHLSAETGLGSLLEDYQPQAPEPDPEEEGRFALQNLLRSLAEQDWTVTVTPDAADHAVHLRTAAPLPASSARITVELLTRRGEAVGLVAGSPVDAAFTAVTLADITPFLVLTVEADGLRESSVVPGRLVGDPADRLDAVLARQVDTPEKFLRFLLLVLGLSGAGPLAGNGSGSGGASWWGIRGGAVFELLARALADNPGALDDLARIVERLSRTEAGLTILPAGFLSLWDRVLEARGLVAAGR